MAGLVFGDDDPEDAWDASDPVRDKVAVLQRWVPSVEAEVNAGDLRNRARFRALDALGHLRPLLARRLARRRRRILVALEGRLLHLLDVIP